MNNTIKLFFASALVLGFLTVISSCSKNEVSVNEPLVAGETLAKQPDSGLYVVARFVDQGVNKTSLFAGYTFLFDDNGDLIVFIPDQTVTGTWSLNMAETVITITVPGTGALNNIDSIWTFFITDTRTSLRDAEPDKLVFAKLKSFPKSESIAAGRSPASFFALA